MVFCQHVEVRLVGSTSPCSLLAARVGSLDLRAMRTFVGSFCGSFIGGSSAGRQGWLASLVSFFRIPQERRCFAASICRLPGMDLGRPRTPSLVLYAIAPLSQNCFQPVRFRCCDGGEEARRKRGESVVPATTTGKRERGGRGASRIDAFRSLSNILRFALDGKARADDAEFLAWFLDERKRVR